MPAPEAISGLLNICGMKISDFTRTEKVAVGVPAKQRELFIRMIPLGRPGTADEAAGVILFFASPLSDYVSGQILVCGGGFSM